jgi:hypothetical protein
VLAITCTPKTYNFAINDNPQYWINKLKNREALDDQCKVRGIGEDEIRLRTKREVASILIEFDKERTDP